VLSSWSTCPLGPAFLQTYRSTSSGLSIHLNRPAVYAVSDAADIQSFLVPADVPKVALIDLILRKARQQAEAAAEAALKRKQEQEAVARKLREEVRISVLFHCLECQSKNAEVAPGSAFMSKNDIK
jgi:hypothetical protein